MSRKRGSAVWPVLVVIGLGLVVGALGFPSSLQAAPAGVGAAAQGTLPVRPTLTPTSPPTDTPEPTPTPEPTTPPPPTGTPGPTRPPRPTAEPVPTATPSPTEPPAVLPPAGGGPTWPWLLLGGGLIALGLVGIALTRRPA